MFILLLSDCKQLSHLSWMEIARGAHLGEYYVLVCLVRLVSKLEKLMNVELNKIAGAGCSYGLQTDMYIAIEIC